MRSNTIIQSFCGGLPIMKIIQAALPFVILSFVGSAFADTVGPMKVVPSKTKVAVLSIVDETSIRDDADKTNQPLLAKQFTDRGFHIIDDNKIAKAVADLKINLMDKSQQTDDNLYKIGKAAGANLVVFDVITDKHEKGDEYFHTARVGFATLNVWLLDVSKQQPILDAKEVIGKERGPFSDQPRPLVLHAVGNAIGDSLKDFLSAYPVTAAPAK
jgi:hypothetical protein